MSTIKLKCTLLTDVILNQKSATEGNRKTLDFIPGNNFLGIVASALYDEVDRQDALILFHTGDVKFGDAHPSVEGIRGLKIPASMYYPKLKKMTDECYIHHLIPNLDAVDLKNKQLKQCRSGFYCFSRNEGREVQTVMNFAIKSAYDKANRRSKDEMMYGYESLAKGSTFYFEVDFNDKSETYREKVKSCLIGKKRIGRSRSAQYGLVEIEEFNFIQPESVETNVDYVTVYADGRLIFLDEFGVPTFRPSAKDLGFSNGEEICWEKSQIRTFQYAPWNFKRQTYDMDRCGIEKGSVFVVKLNGTCTSYPKYVGCYQNEGFGKVICNPSFLEADKDGKSVCKMSETCSPSTNVLNAVENNSLLLKYLKKKKADDDLRHRIYSAVNDFVSSNLKNFKGEERFASQWGAIRGIAMRCEENRLKEAILDYISHGVASEKWEKKRRNEILKCFLDCFSEAGLKKAVINLAAEMGKFCKWS